MPFPWYAVLPEVDLVFAFFNNYTITILASFMYMDNHIIIKYYSTFFKDSTISILFKLKWVTTITITVKIIVIKAEKT